MSSRPRIKLNPNPTDKLLDLTGFLLLGVLWIMVLYNYSNAPDVVAKHFDSSGSPDSYGEKTVLLIAPIAATITFFLLYFLNKSPHLFNYNVTITEENAPIYYGLATRMIRLMNICMLLTFFAVAYTMAMGGSSPIVLIIAVTLPVLPIVWYMVQAAKLKNK